MTLSSPQRNCAVFANDIGRFFFQKLGILLYCIDHLLSSSEIAVVFYLRFSSLCIIGFLSKDLSVHAKWWYWIGLPACITCMYMSVRLSQFAEMAWALLMHNKRERPGIAFWSPLMKAKWTTYYTLYCQDWHLIRGAICLSILTEEGGSKCPAPKSRCPEVCMIRRQEKMARYLDGLTYRYIW